MTHGTKGPSDQQRAECELPAPAARSRDFDSHEHIDEALDEALAESFPASDPVSIAISQHPDDAPRGERSRH